MSRERGGLRCRAAVLALAFSALLATAAPSAGAVTLEPGDILVVDQDSVTTTGAVILVDPVTAPWLGVVAESGCRYFAELAFPDPLVVGLAVTRLGTSSVTYRLAVFEPREPGSAEPVAAVGHWVHVYVDRTTRRPTPIPDAIRALLATAQIGG